MQPYSDYEIAQRQVQTLRDKKDMFRVWLVVFLMMLFVALVSGGSASCSIPLAIVMGVFATATGIDLYYSLPEHAPNKAELEQEMEWLFGKDWQDRASTLAYESARQHIHRRRLTKWAFVGHVLFFIPLNGWIAFASRTAFHSDGIVMLAVALIWTIVLITHAMSAFPTARQLEIRERRFGKDFRLQYEINDNINAQLVAKLKPDTYYVVNGGGEFEAIGTIHDMYFVKLPQTKQDED